METDLFDPNELQSRLQRTLCETLLGRGQEVTDSLASAYLSGKNPPAVRFEYHRSMYFNAFAQNRQGPALRGLPERQASSALQDAGDRADRRLDRLRAGRVGRFELRNAHGSILQK